LQVENEDNLAMKFLIPIFNRRKEPSSRTRYWISNAIWWLYTVIWIIILFSLWYFWDASLLYKLVINFILILGTPALSDLFKPYDKYKKEWEMQYKKRDVQEGKI